jgi:ketosteroid isomerase-like protein
MAASGFFPAATIAQGEPTAVSARAGIDAGNQAWINGIKSGDVARISATYAEDAVDCGPTGECLKGRAEIERSMKARMASLGRARSAAVHSSGLSEQGAFVYELDRMAAPARWRLEDLSQYGDSR